MMLGVEVLATLVVVLIVLIAYFTYVGWCRAPPKTAAKDSFAGVLQTAEDLEQKGSKKLNPYTRLNTRLDVIKGYRNTGFNQPPVYDTRRGLDLLARSKVTPAMIQQAVDETYYAPRRDGDSKAFNTEHAFDQAASVTDHFANEPAMDYEGYITDSIADPRMRENQVKWISEMKPWSGTSNMVDDLDVEPFIDFLGLKRPEAVAQYNPTQLTEIGPEDLAPNPAHVVI